MILRRILVIILVIFLIDLTVGNVSNDKQIRPRRRRQYSYLLYYLCGNSPVQYTSYFPCPCTTCISNCQIPCSTTTYCQNFNANYFCNGGCCTNTGYYPLITTTITPPIAPIPLCDGREMSAGYCQLGGVCPVGFTCTPQNVCCRCEYGTSIGPCVNSQCPSNYECKENNECCPYQIGK